MLWLRNLTHFLLIASMSCLPLSSQEAISQEIVSAERVLDISNLRTYDDFLFLVDALERGDLEKRCSLAELEQINHFLITMAREGLLPDNDETVLESDIEEFLMQEQQLFSSLSGGEMRLVPAVAGFRQELLFVQAGWISNSWKATKKFVKKHKTEILIGVAAVAVGGIVVYVIVSGSSAAAGAVAGAAAVAAGTEPKAQAKKPAKDPQVKQLVKEKVTSFKQVVAEKLPPEHSVDEIVQRSFAEELKHTASRATHELIDTAADLFSDLPKFAEGVNELTAKAHSLFSDRPLSESSPADHFEETIASAHKQVDRFFATDYAASYSPEAKAQMEAVKAQNPTHIGILPPPGMPLGGRAALGEATLASREAIALAEEVGAVEAAGLKQLTTLEETAAGAVKSLQTEEAAFAKPNSFTLDAAGQQSYDMYERAKTILEPYAKKVFEEAEAKKLIDGTGLRTFDRPKGVPANFRVKLSDEGIGLVYMDPKNEHISIRVMPGKPHSKNPCQQKPYVVQMRDGMAVDKFGNRVHKAAPEAHIPIEEFIYRDK